MAGCIDLQPPIDRAGVLRFLGYPEGREPPPRIAAQIDILLPEARTLLKSRGAWCRLETDRAREVGLEPMEATALVLGIVTAGPGIESRANRCLIEGNGVAALILDAAGSAAAEEAADLLSARIARDAGDPASARGPEGPPHLDAGPPGPDAEVPAIPCRISPGYGRWDLGAQRALFARLPHREVGVTLLPSLLMVPRKSITFALWLGADARPVAGLAGCATCHLETCRYRRRTQA